MIPLTYTITVGQASSLRHIETLRASLSGSVLPVYAERTLRWNTLLNTVHDSLLLANHDVSINSIENDLLFRRVKRRKKLTMTSFECAHRIRETWTGTTNYLNFASYTELFEPFRAYATMDKKMFIVSLDPLNNAIQYLSSGHEPPVIQAAIILAILLHSDIPDPIRGVCSALATYGVLSAHGYTCRDFCSPLHSLVSDITSFQKALDSISVQRNLNHWILYCMNSIELSLSNGLNDIQKEQYLHMPNASTYTRLSSRQQAILRALDKPGSTVQNSTVRRMFGIRQLTASRDLAFLTKIGLLSAHGKSRSTTYTKIG